MEAPVEYIPNLLTKEEADRIFINLQGDLNWEKRDDAPRYEYYCNEHDFPYTYGRGRGVRTYNRQPYHEDICSIQETLEDIYDCELDICFLNMYLDASYHLGWHSDDSLEMDNDRPIITVSLGAARPIQFKRINVTGQDNPFAIEELILQHGSSAAMMPGMQREWKHRIPKVGYQVGVRISLTFRGFVLDALG